MAATVYIKNMVCNRCKMAVRDVFLSEKLVPMSVELGEVVLSEEMSTHERSVVSERLYELGFALIDDRKSRLIEKVKTLVVDLVHQRQNELRTNLSDHIADGVNMDYNYVSNLFSEIEGTTIEQYYIAQRIERVKELLVYDEFTLSEIADMLHYSSVAHLSGQFKKVTGLTPSHFKKIGNSRRKSLDEV